MLRPSLAFWLPPAFCRRMRVACSERREDDDRRHSQRDVARVLAEHSRWRREGGAGARRRHHLERAASRGRSRIAGGRGRRLHHARRVGHRARAARRSGARRSGRRRGAREDSGRHHRLGAEGQRLRQLRGDRQPQGRALAARGLRNCSRRAARSSCCDTPKGRRARSSAKRGFSRRSASTRTSRC